MGSQPGGGQHTPFVDWIAVCVMLLGTIGLGLALPLTSWLIAIISAVAFLAGAAVALAYGIVNHTEDYEVGPAIPADEAGRPDAPPTTRILSA